MIGAMIFESDSISGRLLRGQPRLDSTRSKSTVVLVMTLVDYSDSDDGTEPPGEALPDGKVAPAVSLKRSREEYDNDLLPPAKKAPPALPSSLHNLYANSVRTSTMDDPSMHNGRRRQVPHTVGNWPSFIYLEWLPSNEDLACLDKVIAEAAGQLQSPSSSNTGVFSMQSSLRTDLGARLPLHISLSVPLILTTENKDNFEQDISDEVRSAKVPAFKVVPAGIRWVHNFDMSRYFLILTLRRPPGDELHTLLTTCNRVARKYNLAELYMNAHPTVVGIPSKSTSVGEVIPVTTKPQDHDKFHISIGWTLHKPDSSIEEPILKPASFEDFKISFDNVLLKIGSNISTINLEQLAK